MSTPWTSNHPPNPSPPQGASLEAVLAHYAGLVGEALAGIDDAIEKLSK